ncbi:MAG: electron transfer flavoprotein subunit alpha/FixB family protein [Victivallaceae bacterium]|nr:electron transfer flavoprotein subunit alpha/FixB family protein [Victivallaceae bacterium]
MGKIVVRSAGLSPERKKELIAICPFHAIQEEKDGSLGLNAGCKMCRICTRKAPEVFGFVEVEQPKIDKSKWRGIAVAAEISAGRVHPVSLELLGKARQLAAKIKQPVYAWVAGYKIDEAAETLRRYGADAVYAYDDPALEFFRIEPYTAALEDFINAVKPAAVLVGGTPSGRTLAPRAAARFRTGLTADCTVLDIKENTDLEQIRPAFGGNIMAHINTPNHRPQFASVRYKIFPLPEMLQNPGGRIEKRTLPPEKLASGIEIIDLENKPEEIGIEEAEVIVAAGRGVKRQEDMALIRKLADALHAQVAGTRCLIEAGWLDHKRQIGLSGRTVAPKLIICCGISGSVQFAAGMKGAEKIVAINTDPEASIFNIAHVGITGDLYEIVPALLKKIEQGESL